MADGFADGVVAGMATNNDRYGCGNGFGYGGDWIWIIVLFALFGFGNGGFGFGGNQGGQFPWILNGQNNTDALVQNGFNQAATASTLAGIQSSIINGFGNAEVANCNRAMDAMQTAYENQIASMNTNFAMQQSFDKCCCENRIGIADLKATVLSENCADRAVLADGVRDIITNQTANTQRILDTLCQDKIDAKNEKILELQNALNMASLRESQTAQNAFISQGFANEVDALYNRLSNCPVPSTPVYGRTPIFTCGGSCGCNGSSNI